jgi:transketolase
MAALRQGWKRFVGETDDLMGMNGFGASGPEDQLFVHFSMTPENVAAEMRRSL